MPGSRSTARSTVLIRFALEAEAPRDGLTSTPDAILPDPHRRQFDSVMVCIERERSFSAVAVEGLAREVVDPAVPAGFAARHIRTMGGAPSGAGWEPSSAAQRGSLSMRTMPGRWKNSAQPSASLSFLLARMAGSAPASSRTGAIAG